MPLPDTQNVNLADDSTSSFENGGRPPKRPILFFDGVCGLCNNTVNFLLKRDKRQVLLFAPLQGATAEALLEDACRDLKSLVFLENGQVTRKSTAVVRILWRIGGLWRFAAALLWVIPYPLRDLGYGLVARYRYLLFGKKETCRIPSPAERARFLP